MITDSYVIQTEFLGPDDYHGSRIKATWDNETVIIDRDMSKRIEECHEQAAKEMRVRYCLLGSTMIGGEKCGGGYVFILLDEHHPLNNVVNVLEQAERYLATPQVREACADMAQPPKTALDNVRELAADITAIFHTVEYYIIGSTVIAVNDGAITHSVLFNRGNEINHSHNRIGDTRHRDELEDMLENGEATKTTLAKLGA